MLKIAALEKLVHELHRLPGVGTKTAQRLAYHLLKSPELSVQIQTALEKVRTTVHFCPTCFSFTDEAEDQPCSFCKDPNRRDELICVVEEPIDIARIEGSGAFRGRYHVLHGAISPLDHITPRDLRITELIARVEAGDIEEIILALDTDLEGDTTALYLSQALQNHIASGRLKKLTRIASGVPMGTDIDFIDDRTLGRALQNRVEL